jgi:hypothetical protein
VHDDITVTVLQVVTRLMAMEEKYNFLNNCYNYIINMIIHLIPSNHEMPKDLYVTPGFRDTKTRART